MEEVVEFHSESEGKEENTWKVFILMTALIQQHVC